MSEITALVLTDIVDSTHLNEALGDAVMGPLWLAHDAVARRLMQEFGGQEVARSDGFLILFSTPLGALGFAARYHRALRSLDVRLRARAGLHVGEVQRRANSEFDRQRGAPLFEIDGVSLPVVSRVMSIATGGQTLLTAAAVQTLGSAPFRVQSHGHWRLKGIAEPLELFEAGDENAPFVPPADSAKAYRVVRAGGDWTPVQHIPHNLPAERDAFIGRDEPLRRLQALLDGETRLVTVLGIGGIGKTRLALRHARAWLGDFPGGAWFCDLSTARSGDGVLSAVAQALGVQVNKSDPVAQLGSVIAARGQCLLILDNFEQVARQAEETLGRWMSQAPDAKFIVTSREVLGITGEHTQVLPPLAVQEGAQLFDRRAAAASDRRAVSDADAPVVEALVSLLDGLPLAIELAAARSLVMSPTMLLERMNERFSLLSSRGGRLDRQATLRSTLDWSWDLLSPQEKATLAQLSVFEGGFTLKAAEAVVRIAAEGPQTVVDLLQSLVDKSFLRPADDGRFGLLQTVQEYASQHLQTEGRFDGSGPDAARAAEARHGAYFAQPTGREPASTRHGELDNLAMACRRAAARDDFATATATLTLTWAVLELRGPFKLGLDLSQHILSRGSAPADARVLLVQGCALSALGLFSEAGGVLQTALVEARANGDRVTEAHGLTRLGNLCANTGEIDAARMHLAAALALARDAHEQELECKVLNGLGTLDGMLGRTRSARADFDAGLALARRIGNRRWEGLILANLGSLQYSQGRLDDACASYAASIAIAREHADRQGEANALCNLGLMCQLKGDTDAARGHHASALRVAREIGHARLELIVLFNAAITEQESANFDESLVRFEAAMRAAEGLHDEQTQAEIRGSLGLLHCQMGNAASGRHLIEQAKQRFADDSSEADRVIVLCQSAEAYLLGADPLAAQREFDEARRLADVLAQPSKPFEMAAALARADKALSSRAQGARAAASPAKRLPDEVLHPPASA